MSEVAHIFESEGRRIMWETSDPKLASQPILSKGTPVRLTWAAPALWRVMDASGRVIGHLQASAQRQGVRYRARRFHTASRTFRELGEFWSADDAIECLRFAR